MALDMARWPPTPLMQAICKMNRTSLRELAKVSGIGFLTLFKCASFHNTERKLRRYVLEVNETTEVEPKMAYRLVCQRSTAIYSLYRSVRQWNA